MALRVLLADESTTIKKVMQLALQDFAVDVKAVHVGVDVVEVARSFQPDIVFADVLLQKRNGYDICADLKRDPELKTTPVVLMWSSFMELDEKLAAQSGADNRLEKPFDVESLRQLILALVPRTRSQRLAHFLKFPSSVTEPMKSEESKRREASLRQPVVGPVPTQAPPRTPPPPPPPSSQVSRTPPPPPSPSTAQPTPTKESPAAPSSWNMDSFEDISSFADEIAADEIATDNNPSFASAATSSASAAAASSSPSSSSDEPIGGEDIEPWSHQDLSRFRIELPPVSVESEEFSLSFDLSEVETGIQGGEFLLNHTNTPATSQSLDQDGRELEDNDGATEIPLSIETPLTIDSNPAIPTIPQATSPKTALTDFAVPQLEADRLEEIIRAQSREIIESVVRRIVPDIASELIKQEIQRLLEDTSLSSVRESPDQETRR